MEGMNEGIHPIRPGLILHRVDGKILLASQGRHIVRSTDNGETWRKDGLLRLTWWQEALSLFPPLRRVTRSEASGILLPGDGARLCVAFKGIFRADPGSGEYRRVFRFPRGFRPLNLCAGPDGRIYWGEYFLNLRSSNPVRIYGSADEGRSWQVVFTFPAGAICHVHRIVYDPYADALLVCTGDREEEAGIWQTKDGFRSLTILIRTRTTALISCPRAFLYGTDYPRGENFIMALDRQSGRATKIQKVPGPVLYGSKVGRYAVFASMAERRDHEVTVWAGNEKSFQLAAHFPVRKSCQIWRELAGYSTVILPEGAACWPYLFCTPRGTSLYAGNLLRLNLEEQALSSGRMPLRCP